jgi:hypothetical protein
MSDAGYNLYHATGPGPECLDYAQPWAQVGPESGQIQTEPLAPAAVHWFAVRPVDARGIESPLAQDEVRLELDAAGKRVADRPAAVLSLAATPRPGGAVRLQWRWRAGINGVLPQVFRIFGDGGTGTIDYGSPLGEVACHEGQLWYSWTSGPLGGGEHQLAVRSVTAAGATDEQATVVSVMPDAGVPGAVSALQAEAIL